MCKVKYFICPMSKNIVDAVIEMNSDKLGLLPTRRQVDYNLGYVNNWNTNSFFKYVRSKSNIIIERDHSGPEQGDGDEFYSYEEDSDFFNIVHIDPWKKYKNIEEGANYTSEIIKYFYGLNRNLKYEIGTEESIRKFSVLDLDYFLEIIFKKLNRDMFNNIMYVCIQSGVGLDLVNRKNNGKFDFESLKKMISLCKYFGLKTKEHNGDYLKINEIKIRFDNGLDAINIGPEIAQLETEFYLNKMSNSEINSFYEICLKSKKWEKWVNSDFDINDKKSLIMVCGHYNFNRLNLTNINSEIKELIKNKLNNLLTHV